MSALGSTFANAAGPGGSAAASACRPQPGSSAGSDSHVPASTIPSSPARSAGGATLKPLRPSRAWTRIATTLAAPQRSAAGSIRCRSDPPRPLRNLGGKLPETPTERPLMTISRASSTGSRKNVTSRPRHVSGTWTTLRYHTNPPAPAGGFFQISGTATSCASGGAATATRIPVTTATHGHPTLATAHSPVTSPTRRFDRMPLMTTPPNRRATRERVPRPGGPPPVPRRARIACGPRSRDAESRRSRRATNR